MVGRTEETITFKIYIMPKCRRCNRELKREPWRSKGIGQVCEKKETIDSEKASAETGDVIVPYDGGDIFIERLASPTYDDRGQLTIATHTCSGIKTNVQRIETRHSPTGFNFGYGGSGPADTALNVCLMFTDKGTANKIHQDFKREFLGYDGDRLVIPKETILKFIEEKKKELYDTANV
jgi:hypothetical protein